MNFVCTCICCAEVNTAKTANHRSTTTTNSMFPGPDMLNTNPQLEPTCESIWQLYRGEFQGRSCLVFRFFSIVVRSVRCGSWWFVVVCSSQEFWASEFERSYSVRVSKWNEGLFQSWASRSVKSARFPLDRRTAHGLH